MKQETPEEKERRIAYQAQYRLENRPVKFKKQKVKKKRSEKTSDADKTDEVLHAKQLLQKQEEVDKRILSDSSGFTRHINKRSRTRF